MTMCGKKKGNRKFVFKVHHGSPSNWRGQLFKHCNCEGGLLGYSILTNSLPSSQTHNYKIHPHTQCQLWKITPPYIN